MSLEQYNEARQTIIHVVLGTDMKYHFDHLTKFKTRRGSDAFEAPERKVTVRLRVRLRVRVRVRGSYPVTLTRAQPQPEPRTRLPRRGSRNICSRST